MTAPAAKATWADLIAEGRGARLALITLGVWLNAADALVTSTIMPTVARELGGYAFFSWATAAYMVGAIFSGATAATLTGRFGLRSVMVGAGLATAFGCVVSAAASDMIVLVLGRALQGLGAGWILGACYVAIGTLFPERHLARVFGVITSVWGVATVLGPLIGGLFADRGAWRALFWAFAVQSLAFAAAVPALSPAARGPRAKGAPWRQLALVILGVGLIGAADLTAHPGAAAALGLASFAVFVLAARTPQPEGGLFPRDAGRPTTLIGAAYLSFFALTAASMGFAVYAPALLQKLYGLSPLASGYAAGLESVGWTAAALAVTGLGERWHGLAIRLGAASIVGAVAALALVMRDGPLAGIFLAALVMGAGFGLSTSFTSRRVIAAAAGERELASAGINSARLVGNSAGACLAGLIANLFGVAAGLSPVAARTTAVWLFVAAVPVAIAGALGAWRVGARDVRES